jgi:hypothetical protein
MGSVRLDRRATRRFLATTGCVAAIALAAPAQAQDEAQPAAPELLTETSGGDASRQVYTPDYFTRYAPKNALDMLNQVPGFDIRESAEQRGLGQATGNVLFNGVRPSSKSDDIFSQLTRIPASQVQRVEIVDGSQLDIPGLSGQVANVVFEASSSVSGQFSWVPEFRPHNTDPLLWRGDVSVNGKSGDIAWEAALNNADSGRGGADGETLILAGDGSLIQRRFDVVTSDYDSPKLSGKVTWDPAGSSVLNLNGAYQRIYNRFREDGERFTPGQPDEFRTVRQKNDTWNYEIGGDYSFGVGPGTFKAIGLRRFSHEPLSVTVISEFADGSASIGDRFTQTGDLGETIARGEYTWKMFGGDWQLAGEAAYNTLDNVSALFVLDPDGDFVEVPFPTGTGGVSEDRYEGSLSFGRSLTPKLSFQLNLAAEHSTITQTGANGLERTFFRPKGKLSFAWKPSSDLDMAFSVQRRVLQLSFYDFLARAFIDDDNQNSGNNELRPQQDWSYEAEINKSLGAWGKTQLRFIYRDVEDYVDIIPVPGGEAVGNIDKSWARAVVSSSTFNLDPIGFKGAKIDATFVLQGSELRDPFTGEKRQWRGFNTRQANVAFRHDIPGSDWAWGAQANHNHVLPSYRSNQVDRNWEGPWFASVFVEHKDVFGLTVRARAGNLLGARQYRERIVYEGIRGETPIDFVELRDRRIGPIFTLTVRGNF